MTDVIFTMSRGRLIHPETVSFKPDSRGTNSILLEIPGDIECEILKEPELFPDERDWRSNYFVLIKYNSFIIKTAISKTNIKITQR